MNYWLPVKLPRKELRKLLECERGFRLKFNNGIAMVLSKLTIFKKNQGRKS
jgi:hypothetical protein